MWFGIWASRRRGEDRWNEFVQRYYEFRPTDCDILCPNHHAEIHKIYDKIIQTDKDLTNKNLSEYSWKEATILMDKLEEACWEWLKQETPGINSKLYRKKRRGKR